LRLPVPDAPGKPLMPEELGNLALASPEGPLDVRAVEGNRVRTGAWVALGAGLVLGAGAALGFGLATNQAPRSNEAMAYNAASAGAAVGGGVALIVGVALVALDLSRPSASLHVSAGPTGVAVAGRF